MINLTLKLLEVSEWYGISENIEIAKGKNKLPQDWNDTKKRFKRQLKWRLRR
jgi:hypothetical protein